MMNRRLFREWLEQIPANPSDDDLFQITDDLGYVEILLQLARQNPTLRDFDDDEPLFLRGQINWPGIKKKCDSAVDPSSTGSCNRCGFATEDH
jgi:hypothetical protein